MPAQTFRIALPKAGDRSAPVRVGRSLAPSIAGVLFERPGRAPIALISDSRVAARHAARIRRSLLARGLSVRLFKVRAGESAKSRSSKAALEDRLLAAGFGRDALVLAIGGGSLLDLAGFTAATFMRGVSWIALPTTLLAMVDASIGGKVAINHPRGKNLIGAFHHPEGVFADVTWLESLPDKSYRSGLAEIVKIAFGLSAPLFKALETGVEGLLKREADLLERVIADSIRLKARVVSEDAGEEGPRQVLNFGHTIGHAIEAATAYRMPHGEAVAIGIVVEAGIACRQGRLSESGLVRLRRLLERLGLPAAAPRRLDPKKVLRLSRADKKARGGVVRYALPMKVGRMDPDGGWSRPVPDADVLAAWREAV